MNAQPNPFAAHQHTSIPFAFPPGDNWDAFLARLVASQWQGSIIGPRGSGKTTFIEQLAPLLSERGFVPRLFTLRNENAMRDKRDVIEQVRSMRAPEFLLLDGAEQLTTRDWLTLQSAAHACAGTVLTLYRAGRLPVLLEITPTPALLDALVQEISGGARLPAGEAATLFHRHRSDLRACLRELAERWAG